MNCQVCQNSMGNKDHLASEMMFGLKNQFEYLECGSCGCVQIKEVPKQMEKYYPDNYYSFAGEDLDNPSLLKKILVHRPIKKPDFRAWIKESQVKTEDKILDVGCGGGHLLHELSLFGYKNLEGCDAFIDQEINYKNGINIYKKELTDLEGPYDFIMLHHSFEHMSDPLSALKEIYRLLNSGGQALIRIPVASQAWKKYGVNWVQLDAPRHFFLHTIDSMQILAQQANLKINNIVFDSRDFQFWGSEQYLKDIPLRDPRSLADNPKADTFSKQQIKSWRKQAKELNKNQQGDQACFYLHKI